MAANRIAREAEDRFSLPRAEEGGASGSHHNPPEFDISFFLHYLSDDIPLAHTYPSASDDGIARFCCPVKGFPKIVDTVSN